MSHGADTAKGAAGPCAAPSSTRLEPGSRAAPRGTDRSEYFSCRFSHLPGPSPSKTTTGAMARRTASASIRSASTLWWRCRPSGQGQFRSGSTAAGCCARSTFLPRCPARPTAPGGPGRTDRAGGRRRLRPPGEIRGEVERGSGFLRHSRMLRRFRSKGRGRRTAHRSSRADVTRGIMLRHGTTATVAARVTTPAVSAVAARPSTNASRTAGDGDRAATGPSGEAGSLS